MCLSRINSIFSVLANMSKIYTWIKSLIEKIKFKKLPYYFDEYEKHVTIYKNGNGIIINSFTVVINNSDQFTQIKRCINIEDGNKYNKFPTLIDMKKTNIEDRFNKFGFWYDSDDKIISGAKEFYWSDTDDKKENKKLKSNKKELRWIFEVNQSKIDTKKKYKIIYIISIPGLYPIENGLFNLSISNDPNSADSSSSSMNIQHMIKKLTYIISFENIIKLECEPSCEVLKNKQDNIDKICKQCNHEYNIIYNKYIFKIMNPSLNSNIIIKWKFNETLNIQEEIIMDKECGD